MMSPALIETADRKARILAVAEHRFLHYGISKTTMRDIAQDLGVSVGNLYLYFKNKSEIVLAIAAACRAQQDIMVESVLSNATLTSAKKLENFFIDKFRFVTGFRNESPHGKELIAYLIQENPQMLTQWRERFIEDIEAILSQGKQMGEFDFGSQSIHAAAQGFYHATRVFFLPAYVEIPLYPTEAELSTLVRWLVRPLMTTQRIQAQAKDASDGF